MNVAFIPVRGGSKSIPLKNIKEIAQHPLVYWVTKAANDSQSIDKVYIATDCEAIGNVVRKFDLPKVEVIGRSKEFCYRYCINRNGNDRVRSRI